MVLLFQGKMFLMVVVYLISMNIFIKAQVTTTGRNTMRTLAGSTTNSMNKGNGRPAPGEDPVGKDFMVYNDVKYDRAEKYYYFTDNGYQIKRIWKVNAADRTDIVSIIGPTYDVESLNQNINAFDEKNGNSIVMTTTIEFLATGLSSGLDKNVLYFAQGIQRGSNTYRKYGWIRKAEENADGSWSVEDYVGVHTDGGDSKNFVSPTTAPTQGVIQQPGQYASALREAKSIVPTSLSNDNDETYGSGVFNDMEVNPVDNMLYLAAGFYSSSSSSSDYKANFNEYNWKISRIRKINGIDYIEYWAGLNNINHCFRLTTSVTGFTGFPHSSCTSTRSLSASDYADGLDKELTLMRPQLIAFDGEGNCYYWCELSYQMRKIQASDSKVYTLFGQGYSASGVYIEPNTNTLSNTDFQITYSRYDHDLWYDGGNYPIDNNYPLAYLYDLDVDGYGNLYISKDYMLLVYKIEGDYAGKFEFLANMRLSSGKHDERLAQQYPAGYYDNELTGYRDPLSYRDFSYGSYGMIRSLSVKKYGLNATNTTDNANSPLGDVLFVDQSEYLLSSIQFMCPAGYVRAKVENQVDLAAYPNGTGVQRVYECRACPRGSYTSTENGQDACTSCALSEYMELEYGSTSIDDCQPCPAGSYCPDVMTKIPCPAGSFSSFVGSTTDTCGVCPAGSFCPEGAAQATLCVANFYQDQPGKELCITCGAGKVSNPGAADIIGCVNPVPNFAMGFICLGVVLGTIFMYVSHGRFHRVAFVRKYRALNLLFFEAKNVSNSLTTLILKHQVPEEYYSHQWSFYRVFIVFIWVVASTTLLIMAILVTYVLSLSKVLFHSLLIWRGMSAPDLGFVAKMEQVGEAFRRLGFFKYIGLLMSPFISFIEFISGFSIDLNSVEVTCVGAQAPMELLINCFVLGFIVIIIESDFQVFQNMVFGALNRKSARAMLVYPLGLPNNRDVFFKCCIAVGIATLKPMEKMLQFTMSLLNFKSFLSHQESYLAHAKTDSCDTIDGAPYVDTCLAYITSLMFWYMLLPAIYTLASVCVPYGDNVPEEFRVIVPHKDDETIEFVEEPLLPDEDRHLEAHGRICPPKLADQLTRTEFEDIVVMFDEIDVDGSGTISEDELEQLFFKMGVVASEMKTKMMFEKADVDGGGEIDFDEFCDFVLMMKKEDKSGFDYLVNAFDSTAKHSHSGFTRMLKMSSYVAPDLLMTSVALAWLNKLVTILDGRARFLWKQVSTAPFRRETQEERSAWVRQQEDAIPTYFGLCKAIFDEFYELLLFWFGIEDIPTVETKVIFTTSKAGEAEPITTKQTKTQLKHIVRWKLLNMDKDSRGVLKRDDLQQNTPLLQFTAIVVYIISFFLSYLLPLPIGHLMTRVGRVMWRIVLKKYWIFLQVCLGVWTDDCVVGYNLVEEAKIKIDDDINLIQMVDEKLQHDKQQGKTDDELLATIKDKDALIKDDIVVADTEEGNKITESQRFSMNTEKMSRASLDEIDGSAMDDDGFEMADTIEALVGTRAIIIQIIPMFSYLSIFAVGTSHTPLFVISEKARRFFPPLLIRDSMTRAAIVEMKEANHRLTAEERGISWINLFRAGTIYVSASRLPQAMINYFWFAVTVGILYDDPFRWILMSIVISFPFLVAGLIEAYVITGKAIGIVDEDVSFLFRMFGKPIPVRASEEHFIEHGNKGFSEAAEKSAVGAQLQGDGGVYADVKQDDVVEEQAVKTNSKTSSFFFWDNEQPTEVIAEATVEMPN